MTVMVFGVFDTFHLGHQFFLKSALNLSKGGRFVVVVARDVVVQHLKNKTPRYGEQERIDAVQKFLPEATVVIGDERQGSYDVVKRYKPDMIVLGFDQQQLAADLKAKMPDVELVWSTQL